MSDDIPRRLRIWLVRCRRHVHPPSVTEIGDTLSLTIAKLERMRGVAERLQQGQQREPGAPTVTGRPTRVGGGMAR